MGEVAADFGVVGARVAQLAEDSRRLAVEHFEEFAFERLVPVGLSGQMDEVDRRFGPGAALPGAIGGAVNRGGIDGLIIRWIGMI
jgi:hypothetical protein